MKQILMAALAATLAGCVSIEDIRIDQVAIDTAPVPKVASVDNPAPKLRCPYRLAAVVDARPDGERAGRYGTHVLVLEDAAGLVRDDLLGVGLAAPDAASGRAVDVRVLRVYLKDNNMTKVPVVVCEARIDSGAPFLVRTQTTTLAWANGKGEGRNALRRALVRASWDLVEALNARCGKAA
jgi:hypothetical protein